MKKVDFNRTFIKHYRLRIRNNARLSKQYDKRYKLFVQGKRDNQLNDHPLEGAKLGLRSFSMTTFLQLFDIKWVRAES